MDPSEHEKWVSNLGGTIIRIGHTAYCLCPIMNSGYTVDFIDIHMKEPRVWEFCKSEQSIKRADSALVFKMQLPGYIPVHTIFLGLFAMSVI